MNEVDVKLRGVTKRFGDFVAVDSIDLDIYQGQFVTLLGPSGCGKTTTLRMIGGFEYSDAGTIEVAGEPINSSPAHHHTRMVFQNYALFPHMRIRENVVFGLRMAKLPEAEIRKSCAEIIAMLGLEGQEDKYPNQLSGGQQQRAALARALITRPRVLLLDEPLGALDLKMRKRMQAELKNLQKDVGITFIYVTHDQEEAMNLSDVVVVMEKGKIVQTGTPEEIYRSPSSPYVADFIGETNLIEGKVIEFGERSVRVETELGEVKARHAISAPVAIGSRIMVAVRPENLLIGPDSSNAERKFKGRVREHAFLGASSRLTVESGGISLSADRRSKQNVAIDEQIEFGWQDEDALALAPRD